MSLIRVVACVDQRKFEHLQVCRYVVGHVHVEARLQVQVHLCGLLKLTRPRILIDTLQIHDEFSVQLPIIILTVIVRVVVLSELGQLLEAETNLTGLVRTKRLFQLPAHESGKQRSRQDWLRNCDVEQVCRVERVDQLIDSAVVHGKLQIVELLVELGVKRARAARAVKGFPAIVADLRLQLGNQFIVLHLEVSVKPAINVETIAQMHLIRHQIDNLVNNGL